jgi:hypothetical protein
MFYEELQYALNNIEPLDEDNAAWLRFCDWLESFHDIDTAKLQEFGNFAVLEKNGELKLPLEFLESIEDLWIKWSKAAQVDSLSGA